MTDSRRANRPGEGFEPPSAEDRLWVWAEALAFYVERWYDVLVELSWAGGRLSLWTKSSPQISVSVDDDRVVRVTAGYWFYAARPLLEDTGAVRELGGWIVDVVLGVADGGLIESAPADEPLPQLSIVLTRNGTEQATEKTFPDRNDPEHVREWVNSEYDVRDAIRRLEGGRWPAWPLRATPLQYGHRAPRPGDATPWKRLVRRMRGR